MPRTSMTTPSGNRMLIMLLAVLGIIIAMLLIFWMAGRNTESPTIHAPIQSERVPVP